MSKTHSNQNIDCLSMEEKKERKKHKNTKKFIDFSQTTDNVWGNLEGYNPFEKKS